MKLTDNKINWKFSKDNDGSFYVEDANKLPVLYFPLMNTAGLKSFVTPELKGDICSDFDHYLTTPTVTEEIHRTVSSRNFWIKTKNEDPWSATGQSVYQKSESWKKKKEDFRIYAKIGSFTTERTSKKTGLKTSIITFVPETDDLVELLKITVTNTSEKKQIFSSFYSLPLFGRSADNIRDHRQVTTMFQENFLEEYGVRIKPKIFHDEISHSINTTNYLVLGFDQRGKKPKDIWIRLHDFIGQGGTIDNPKAIFHDLKPPILKPMELHGKEAIAGFKFEESVLEPGEKREFIILHGISDNKNISKKWGRKYGEISKVDKLLKKTHSFWKKKLSSLDVNTNNKNFDNWVKWIEYQVKCRQIFGNSFLPDYGYGRGGRGWRDLWQDLLSIFLVDPNSAHQEIINCFKGIRIDGSNATIIGEKPGDFKADRNNIPRTWSDHGAWPVFVLNFYINQTGDLDILDQQISFWKDKFIHRNKKIDEKWISSQGHIQKTKNGTSYTSSIFEHLLVQQLSAFYNVNNKNILLLEGADWNDTFDMAREKGGSVCFYNFYSANFITLKEMLLQIKKTGKKSVLILREITQLLDYLPGQYRINYQNPKEKRALLKKYFNDIQHTISGIKESVLIDDLIIDLESKSRHISSLILKNEILKTKKGDRFFNGHYDNLENQMGGEKTDGIMMDLTSQVMPILCNTADKEMSLEIYATIKKVLKDEDSPGIRLTTEFKSIDLNIGRITGFVYGYKEHGSKWIQQNIMLAYALYKKGLVTQGHEIMQEVYEIANNREKAKIFPGIPSYFDNQNKGAYAYLTGSSSWYLLTLITEVFGIKGVYGALHLEPKLSLDYFNKDDLAQISTNFCGKKIEVTYKNSGRLNFEDYEIREILINRENYPINSERVSEKSHKLNANLTNHKIKSFTLVDHNESLNKEVNYIFVELK